MDEQTKRIINKRLRRFTLLMESMIMITEHPFTLADTQTRI